MSSYNSTPIRCSLVLVICSLLVAGCSSSSDSNSAGSQSSADVNDTNGDGVTSDEGANGVENESENGTTGFEGSSTTRVNFYITVPVYVSNALQVRLVWGDVNTTAMWNSDELWTASADLPVDTTNQLLVTFSDGNGAITLGSFETTFRTDTNPSESFQIAADEFDTDRWDNDGDGVSNLSESIAGTNPQGNEALEPVQPSLELVEDKTFRITWQPSPGALFYRVLENPDGISGFTDISGELEDTTNIFDHRVALYSRVNAQYLVQSCSDLVCVDSEPVMVTGALNTAIGYFKSNNTGSDDLFGIDVSMSSDGSTLAVGANHEGSAATSINGDQADNTAENAGAVYVFVRNQDTWQQQAYIKASNAGRGDSFGFALNLSADGNTLAVGASAEGSAATGINGDQTGNSADNAGAVYVFDRVDGIWQQQVYVKGSNTRRGDRFGWSVRLSADGNTLAVGARSENSAATGINGDQNDTSARSSGAVYIFVRNDGLWQQQAYIKASNTGEFDSFGAIVGLSSDGNTLAVSAEGEDSATTDINGDQTDNSAVRSGAVYIFVRNISIWQQQAYIKASNAGASDIFGFDLSLSADGNTLAVGAESESSAAVGINGDQADDSAMFAGAVYVFVRNAESWQQQAYIKASNTDNDDRFGSAVSLSADGSTLAVGAAGEDSAATGINGNQNDNSASGAGAVYAFIRSGELWQQQAYIKASNTDSDDRFGSTVNIGTDTNMLVVGAAREDSTATGINGNQNDNSAENAGAIYLF